MDLSIIIVNWNSLDYIFECVDSIYKNTCLIKFEIIVVDNASTKDDINEIKYKYPKIIILKNKKNLGFAKANNLGFRQANGKYILLLNPDTKLVGPAINLLFKAITSLPNSGIIGCKQVNPDLTVQTSSIQKFPTILNQIFDIEYIRRRWPNCPLWDISPLFQKNNKPVKVDVIPGACMLIPRRIFENVGMLNEDYFMYAEDIDLNYRISKLGFNNYYIEDAIIIHYGGISSSQKKVNQWSTMMKYRAMFKYYKKNYSNAYAVCYRIMIFIIALLRLGIIAFSYPILTSFGRRFELKKIILKWIATLKWSLGFA